MTTPTRKSATGPSSAPRLGAFARRLETDAALEQLALPADERERLLEVVRAVKQRQLAAQPGAAGCSLLLAGADRAGLTQAAALLGRELGLAIIRVDLAGLVSKYIGETEKNLARLFDAAAESDGVLLFDESDALFGARTDVKDSHDRYTKPALAYLLQRIESHRGLTILTANSAGAIDPAVRRRLSLVVEIPRPARADGS